MPSTTSGSACSSIRPGRHPCTATRRMLVASGRRRGTDCPSTQTTPRFARNLASREAGCRWLRQRWEELRAQLGPGKFWQSHDRLKAIRLLGRQPLDAIEDRRIAEIFVASYALNPVGHGPFDDLLSEMDTSQHVRYRKAVKARWPDLVTADETARCRELLIELADRNIERLNAKLEVHEQNADANARRTVDRLGFDQGPDGERIRAYKLKCRNGFFRAMESYRKHQAKKRAKGRERTGEYPPLTANDRERRPGDASRWAAGIEASHHVPDGAFISENLTNEAKIDESMITIQNEEPIDVTAESAVDSGLDKPQEQPAIAEAKCDRVPDGSFVGEDGEREALEQSTDSNALPDQGAKQNGDGMSPRGENRQNDTNEPKVDETAIIIQNKEPVGVVANSGLDSALDKPHEHPGIAEGNDELMSVIPASPPESAEVLRPHLPRSP